MEMARMDASSALSKSGSSQSLLEATVHESQLEEALLTRTTIGQAVGILMAQ